MPGLDALVQDLLARTEATRARMQDDPFGNPVLAISLSVTRMMEDGTLDLPTLGGVIRALRDDAFAGRAERLGRYVGGTDPAASRTAMAQLADGLAQGSIDAFRAGTERVRFAAVFTAHPTFSMPPELGQDLASMASGGPRAASRPSHRPKKPTLMQEFQQASAAITAGRDSIDQLNAALLTAARTAWPGAWTTLIPRPVILTSWVGYDTDGRTDIEWWDTLRLRLQMKAMQLARLANQLRPILAAGELLDRVVVAERVVQAQLAACPAMAEPAAVAAFAAALIQGHEGGLLTPEPLLPLFAAAIAMTDGHEQMALCVARSGLVSHGLSLAHTHVRLNAAQLHNALRQQAGLDDDAMQASRRRAMLAGINEALDRLEPTTVDFGALLAEPSSAVRLMMTVAQITKHIDAATPVRFLIAETESGYTLLCALWLARLFGIEAAVEISPLFETGDALERGDRVLDEALRSRHWRDYLRRTGKMALQFGYSDSGRYVGQLAASYMIERQRLKIAEVLARHGMADIEVILFDTHGESIGRGAHPGTLQDRLKFLNPTRSRKALARSGLPMREESAFQGGDGYLLFGTRALALATVARLAEHVFDPDAQPDANRLPPDPVYEDPDFAADFFMTIKTGMEALVEDPGYAALLGTFGPALLDPTGSRPSARQTDGMGGPALIRHPRELRAIPNNAILQQLGWCANTLQGLGAALARHPQEARELMEGSRRFRRAMDFAAHGLAHSDLDVLAAVIGTLDPGSWLDRAEHAAEGREREGMVAISAALEVLGISAAAWAMLRRIQSDHLALRSVWPDAPAMAPQGVLLHAMRLALVQRIWMLATRIPDFSPRHGITRPTLFLRILRLDIPGALEVLATVFPSRPDEAAAQDYHEPRGFRTQATYEREHTELFQPMGELFALVREIGAAITHEVGAFG